MSVRPASNSSRYLAAVALVLMLAGCGGPTRTAGTSGLAKRDLAVLSIPQLSEEAPLRINTIQFNGDGDEYEIGKGRDFYLLPREHTASFTLKVRIPDIDAAGDGGGAGGARGAGGVGGAAAALGWLLPKELTVPGPKDIPLGVLTAGKTYELAAPADGFEQMLQGGEFSLVREKPK